MTIKDVCEKINNMPTLLATVNINGMDRTICSWATYSPESREITLLYYYGPYDARLEVMTEEMEETEEMQEKEYVAKIAFGENMRVGDNVSPYLTEYDFNNPEDLPEWAAEVWLRRQRANVASGDIRGKKLAALKKRIRSIELREMSERTMEKMEHEARMKYVRRLVEIQKTKVRKNGKK